MCDGHRLITDIDWQCDLQTQVMKLIIFILRSGEARPILACEYLSLSRMPLSYQIMILSPVTYKSVYLWDVPNR